MEKHNQAQNYNRQSSMGNRKWEYGQYHGRLLDPRDCKIEIEGIQVENIF